MAKFPSLVIRRDELVPQGAFAEAQATFLNPDPQSVLDLKQLLQTKNIGVVAHFYMDVELQGVLTACDWPHIGIADSLVMAGQAVQMAESGIRTVIVLGVDFMSENVRAVLDGAGFEDVKVYRVADRPIGCSLAESAEAPAYGVWLDGAAAVEKALHVVYINTSLRTKALAHLKVPTITCTSSNVVQTILQATSQVPDLHIYYGPDSYMGSNLERMFHQFAELDDEAISRLHSQHNGESIGRLQEQYHYFKQGTCVVHHMFGADVVNEVRTNYGDAFYTAHLEVPGEMFELASNAQREGRGVVGSTANILGFISERLTAQIERPGPARLEFVLGTEAGMITAIVNKTQAMLRQSGREDIDVEVIFPVSSEAISAAPESALEVIPGAPAGEGCSVAGGCVTCPFMKMNNLQALFQVLEMVGTDQENGLATFEPKKYTQSVGGRSVGDLGSEPILHMRYYQKHGVMPEELISQIEG
ncbi:MAG: quinolinate synthase NadA [Proteobacteria bacterium]|nr:quinolinate synthase NadA [Pseudomonadota bacterium]